MILKKFSSGSELARIDMLMKVAGEDELRTLRTRRANALKGDAGERETARALDRHFGPSLKMGVAHDVMIESRGVTVQIDHLLVSRILSTAWLVETKNLSGRISINADQEWVQTTDAGSRIIPSPLDQAKGAAMGLGKWLEDNGYGVVNQIVPLVVVPHTTTIDRSTIKDKHNVVKADMLETWWDQWFDDQTLAWFVSKLWRLWRKGLGIEGLVQLGKDLVGADERTKQAFVENARRGPSQVADESQICEGIYTRRTIHGIAIRHRPDEELSRRVTEAAQGIGKWNDHFSNWIVPEDGLAAFSARMTGTSK